MFGPPVDLSFKNISALTGRGRHNFRSGTSRRPLVGRLTVVPRYGQLCGAVTIKAHSALFCFILIE